MIMSALHPFVEKVDAIIETHLLDANFGTQELANYLFIDRVQLFRKLKHLTGFPPQTYIRYYRLEKGQELLYNTKLPIKEIAYDIGFKDPAHFTNAYRNLYGILPSAARK